MEQHHSTAPVAAATKHDKHGHEKHVKSDKKTDHEHVHVDSCKTEGALETAKSMAATGPIFTSGSTFGHKTRWQYTPHPTETMLAVVWGGTSSVSLITVARPMLSSPTDAIVDITATCVCGSDLHFFNNAISGDHMHSGDILGHEAVGIVREIGSEVRNVKAGDRVVISAVIACGTCEYCKRQDFSLCDSTNPSTEAADMNGYRLSGLFGYSSLTGGYAGLQAEVARVPFADCNLLKINNDSLTDEQVVLLSDVMCTAWYGLEVANCRQADTVAIWGCGPVGLMSGYLAKKAKLAYRVLQIDNIPYKLNRAKQNGCETINFDEVDVINTVKGSVRGGPDVCIDCVGFRFPKTTTQKFMYKAGMHTDAIDTVKESIILCKKGGTVSLIGDYFGTSNDFPVGAMMEKTLQVRGGQVFCQKYWKHLLSLIESGEIDPTWLLSHRLQLHESARAYDIFNAQKDNCTKVVLFTKLGQTLAQQRLQRLSGTIPMTMSSVAAAPAANVGAGVVDGGAPAASSISSSSSSSIDQLQPLQGLGLCRPNDDNDDVDDNDDDDDDDDDDDGGGGGGEKTTTQAISAMNAYVSMHASPSTTSTSLQQQPQQQSLEQQPVQQPPQLHEQPLQQHSPLQQPLQQQPLQEQPLHQQSPQQQPLQEHQLQE